MQSVWLYLTCGVVLSAYVLLWSRMRRTRALLASLPSYPQLPLIGNLLQLGRDGRSLFRFLDDASQKANEAMKPFVFWLAQFPILLISDPDDVRVVTNSFIEKPYYYRFGKAWLGDGLVTAPGFLWKQNIKRLANTFNAAVVDGYQVVFNAQAQKLVHNLKKEDGGKPFDVMHLLAYTTLEAICQTALGVDCISESVAKKEYYDAFNRCLILFIERGLNPLLHPDWVYRLTAAHRETQRCVDVVHSVSDTVLKRKNLEREKIKRNTQSNLSTAEARNFKTVVDILLDLSETDPHLTQQQIKNEVDTIIVGGQETVASTIFYAVLMIGCRPQVQQKLHAEFKTIFGGSTRPVEKADLQEMQYCEAVINETLRLFPPLPVVLRYADRELQLKSCRVPKGTTCGINAWGAGRSKRTWGSDAYIFDPERWIDWRIPTHPATFLPFSYGRRACIGKKYAMAILKTVLAYCVRELEFTSEADKIEFKADVALRPVSGHLIKVALRKL